MLKELSASVAKLIQAEGEKLARTWQDAQITTQKDVRDVVTAADVEIENALRMGLSVLLPEAGFVVEEGTTTAEKEYMWIIDPIDQTKNFASKLPLFYVQAALLEQGVPILGVIYQPVSGQCFIGSRGNGVTLDGAAVSLQEERALSAAIVDVDLGGTDDSAIKKQIVGLLVERAYRVRVSGGAYAPYLLTGAIDASIVLNQKTKLVDQAPRIELFREAGLRSEVVSVGAHTYFVTAPETLYTELVSLLNDAHGS